MQEYKPIKERKAREIYDNGDSLIMVAADRISVFDVILKNEIIEEGYGADADVEIPVRLHKGHRAKPHAVRGCKRYAGILPAAAF